MKKTRKCLVLYVLLLSGLLANAQAMFDQQKLHQYLRIQQQRIGFNDVVMIAKNGKTIFSDHLGQASFELGSPMLIKNTFALASISKSFTATLVLLAVDEGKLSLTDSLAKFFPQLEDQQWRSITIGQLLSHRSGIPHNEGIASYWTAKSTQQYTRTAAINEILSLKLIAAPGTITAYSSPGYFVLATLLENVYGKGFGELLKEKICKPLQLENTGQLDQRTIVPNLVAGYQQNEEGFAMAPYRSFSLMKGSGDLYSNGPDLLTFLNRFGTGKWPNALEKEMFGAQSGMPVERGDLYGYGWFISAKSNTRPKAFYHGGGSFGISTLMAWYPAEKLSVVILSNVSALPVQEIWRDIEQLMLGKNFVLPVVRKQLPFTEKEIANLIGNYQDKNGMLLQLIGQNNKLYAKLGNKPAFQLYRDAPLKCYGKMVSIDFIFEQDHNGKTIGITTVGMGNTFSFIKK